MNLLNRNPEPIFTKKSDFEPLMAGPFANELLNQKKYPEDSLSSNANLKMGSWFLFTIFTQVFSFSVNP